MAKKRSSPKSREPRSEPEMRIVAGPNGAGKSTYLAAAVFEGEVIRPDEIAIALAPDAPESAALRAGRVTVARMRDCLRGDVRSPSKPHYQVVCTSHLRRRPNDEAGKSTWFISACALKSWRSSVFANVPLPAVTACRPQTFAAAITEAWRICTRYFDWRMKLSCSTIRLAVDLAGWRRGGMDGPLIWPDGSPIGST
jgi:hypothetical protein